MASTHPPQVTRHADWLSGRKAQRLGGAAMILGNLLFIVNKLDEMSRVFLGRWRPDMISGQSAGLILFGQAALIIGYLAYLQHYGGRAGRMGNIALRLFCGGGIVLAVGHIGFITAVGAEWLFIIVAIGLLVILAGLILFGVAALRLPILTRWRWLPLLTGLMGFIGFFLFGGEEIQAVFLVFRTLFAIGLIGLGLALWREKPAPPARHSPGRV